MALRSALPPLLKLTRMPSVSPLTSWLPKVFTEAKTRSATPKTPTDRSSRWMPVAVIGPAGASFAERRQLSAGSGRDLSCTQLGSTRSRAPHLPGLYLRLSLLHGG